MLSCWTSLAIPKSVTLHVSLSPTNTLRAARSRWIIWNGTLLVIFKRQNKKLNVANHVHWNISTWINILHGVQWTTFLNLLTSYNVKKREKNRAYAQSADKLKYKIGQKVELFHKKLAITTAHLSGQIFAPYSPFLSGKIHKPILSIMAN